VVAPTTPAPAPARAAPTSPPTSHPAATTYVMPPGAHPAPHVQPPPVAAPSRPSNPNLAMTLLGPVPLSPAQIAAAAPPAKPISIPALIAQDDISQIGARPLVTDPKLGWETSVQHMAATGGGHTRLASDVVDDRIRSNGRWWLVAVFLIAFVVAMIVMIVQE
jgi:hypothetical protein